MGAARVPYEVGRGGAVAGARGAPRASSMSSPPLVGREPVLRLLADELEVVAGGRLSVVLVSGEPGVGKTRLLQEFAERPAGRVSTLLGRCYPLGATESFGMWIDALEGRLRALDRAEVRRVCGPALGDLSGVLPSAARAMIGRTPRTPPSRARVLAALVRLLANLSADGPLVVVLDDAHLADGSSWAALGHLAHQLARAPILVLLSARSAELGARSVGSTVIAALHQEGLARRVELGPLDDDALAVLAGSAVGRSPSHQLCRFLVERSGGVPLFALSLLRALLDSGADLAAPVLDGLPSELTGFVERRLAGLAAEDRSTLELMAVLGGRVDFDALAHVSDRPPHDLVAVVDRLVEKGLLVSEVRGATLVHEFSHPIIQEAVYDGIGAARRRAVHRSAARALMASGRRGLAAAHFARYAVPGDDEAIEALRVALADAEAHDNHREALAMLEVLLDLLPPGDRRWLDISDVLAWQTGWVIDHRADVGFGTALRAMRRISALLDATVPAHRRASAKFHLGSFLAWGAGEADEASDRIEEAMAGFEATGDARSLLLARNELGYVRAIAGDMPALDAISEEVSRHAEQSGDRVVQLQALCARAHALLWSGRVPDASGALDHALRIAEDDGNLYRVSYLRAQRAYERALCGEMDAVEGWLGAAREAHGAYLDTHLPDFSSFVHWLAGSLAASVQSGREALAWDGGHISRRRAFGACFAGLSALELGGTDEAASLASGARAAFGGRPWWFHSALPDWLDAALVAARAEPEGAVALLGPAVAHQARIGAHLWAEFMLAELAEAAVAAGDRVTLARAAALVEEARPGPAHPSTPGQRALRRVVSGALAALGRAEDPVAEWRAAATDFAASGWMMWEARARALLAAALGPTSPAAAGEREAAVAQFTGCGASRRADVLRRGGDGATGAAPGRASHSRGSLGELTPREREVAQLAAQGLSARSIGEQLFIGTRTVESHLAHVYAKLGVRSRIALSRLFAGEPSDQ